MTTTEALKWIKDFLTRIDSQDNRGTSNPIQYLLQEKRYIYGETLSNPEITKYCLAEYDYYNFDSKEEILQCMRDNGWAEEDIKEHEHEIRAYEGQSYWETSQAFLTKEGYERHLQLNRHNLKEPVDYVIHAFRNPEMVELFKALRAIDAVGNKIAFGELSEMEEWERKYLGEWPEKSAE